VKLDLETLPTVPDVPPAAGPERALGCIFPAVVALATAGGVAAVGVVPATAELPLEVALAIP
jgi:hypothetical protein